MEDRTCEDLLLAIWLYLPLADCFLLFCKATLRERFKSKVSCYTLNACMLGTPLLDFILPPPERPRAFHPFLVAKSELFEWRIYEVGARAMYHSLRRS